MNDRLNLNIRRNARPMGDRIYAKLSLWGKLKYKIRFWLDL